MSKRSNVVSRAQNGRFNSTKRTYKYKYANKKRCKVSMAYLKLVVAATAIWALVEYCTY